MTGEHFGTGSKKGRGMARRSLELIEAMRRLAEPAQPISGRGVGYKLFTAGLIPSMSKTEMAKVYGASIWVRPAAAIWMGCGGR